jgi:hypothetical protein
MIDHLLRRMSPHVAPSGGRVVSAILPLSGEKQTSSERVKSDAIDPTRASGEVRLCA